jgi:hypothetical protein
MTPIASEEIAMSRIIVKSKRRLSPKLAAGLAISVLLVLGTLATSVSAQERRDDRRGGDARHYRGHDWNGGYYAAPPVVYGSPYYAPPPVVYGPAIGITAPGIYVGIR